MGKNKGARIVITLECSCRNLTNTNKRRKGIFRYTSTKNRKNTPSRIELMKFCPTCNKHDKFKEMK
ncbi:60S ribosomal protein L33 (chloroplast) [Gracilaria domingensis]|uniref:ribosomal protein L33 n=1 Tax=Gracilaria domingensis TaxID=172961 RepID=UPI001D103A45|nr:ribosomal protein L33 [Gracilaria domingensis]KAI0556326.1 60S ribosomal protein L33 [Gracilaria domingensis]UAD85394.1 ribosomal protein L33 [Gracilaria domingensis]